MNDVSPSSITVLPDVSVQAPAPPLSPAYDKFGRKASLIVTSATGDKGKELSNLRFHFEIRQAADPQTPTTAVIRITNPSPDTIDTVTKEYIHVRVQAGYQNGAFGGIFEGQIKQFRFGHETVTESFLDLLCADGDEAFIFAVTNKTLAKGYTQKDLAQVHTDAMKSVGNVNDGFNGLQGGFGGLAPEGIRGRLAYGLATDGLNTVGRSTDTTWYINNGKINIVPNQGYLPGEAVVLNAFTGLVGWPEQTNQGIYVRCLIDPKLKPGGLIQINNKDVTSRFNNPNIQQGNAAWPSRVDIQSTFFATLIKGDGIYKVIVIDYVGDSRGNPWYQDLICLAANTSTNDKNAQVPAGIS